MKRQQCKVGAIHVVEVTGDSLAVCWVMEKHEAESLLGRIDGECSTRLPKPLNGLGIGEGPVTVRFIPEKQGGRSSEK